MELPPISSLARLRHWARLIKRDVIALWLAARDPRVPRHAKLVAAAVAAYALSPIDLIPDIVPVLGYLDDLLLVPAGIVLAVRLIPADILSDLRAKASLRSIRPVSRAGAAAILLIWSLIAAGTAYLLIGF